MQTKPIYFLKSFFIKLVLVLDLYLLAVKKTNIKFDVNNQLKASSTPN